SGIDLADMLELRHDLAGGGSPVQGKVRAALLFAAVLTFPTHVLEGAHPAFVAGTAGLDSLANPLFLLRQTLVEQTVGLLLGSGLLGAVVEKTAVIPIPGKQLAAIQLHHPIGDALEKAAIVGDQQQGAPVIPDLLLQPFN